jgi:hypothetical protein
MDAKILDLFSKDVDTELRCCDFKHNDTQPSNAQYKDTQHYGLNCDIQHKRHALCVVMLSVIILSVMVHNNLKENAEKFLGQLFFCQYQQL